MAISCVREDYSLGRDITYTFQASRAFSMRTECRRGKTTVLPLLQGLLAHRRLSEQTRDQCRSAPLAAICQHFCCCDAAMLRAMWAVINRLGQFLINWMVEFNMDFL
jgi:hypothetical protein